jgi:hypothetical protein
MPSQSKPTIAGGDASPGLAPLAPPAGAFFGRLMLPPFSNSTTLTYPISRDPSSADIVQQSVNEFFVYWINGTDLVPGSYRIIQRQTFITSAPRFFQMGYLAGWMLSQVGTGTALNDPPPNGSLALLTTSPNAGDQYASVKQGMTVRVLLSGEAAAPKYIEVTDQVPLNLPGWAVNNLQFVNWNDSQAHDMNTAYWSFHQTTPWDPTVKPIGQDDSENPWWWPIFNNRMIVPVPEISKSSLSVTTYATWMVTAPGWFQADPAACTVTGSTTMARTAYFLWSEFNGWPPGPWCTLDTQGTVTFPFSLALDQIVGQ